MTKQSILHVSEENEIWRLLKQHANHNINLKCKPIYHFELFMLMHNPQPDWLMKHGPD